MEMKITNTREFAIARLSEIVYKLVLEGHSSGKFLRSTCKYELEQISNYIDVINHNQSQDALVTFNINPTLMFFRNGKTITIGEI